jgi:hypothetical protein
MEAMTAHMESITQETSSTFSKKGGMAPRLLVALDLSGESLKPTTTLIGAQAILANLRSAKELAIFKLQKECRAEDNGEPYMTRKRTPENWTRRACSWLQ